MYLMAAEGFGELSVALWAAFICWVASVVASWMKTKSFLRWWRRKALAELDSLDGSYREWMKGWHAKKDEIEHSDKDYVDFPLLLTMYLTVPDAEVYLVERASFIPAAVVESMLEINQRFRVLEDIRSQMTGFMESRAARHVEAAEAAAQCQVIIGHYREALMMAATTKKLLGDLGRHSFMTSDTPP